MLINHDGYFQVLESIKQRIKFAQYKATMGLNCEQIMLYWNVGKVILGKSKYGNKFVENLAGDIKAEFPQAKGYSVRNLKYMRKFAELFPDCAIVQAVLAQLTWYHHQALMDKTSDNPSIGILLCKEQNKLTAEYALRDINKPIGVSEYRLSDFVPQELADTLPSALDIEKRIKDKYKLDE